MVQDGDSNRDVDITKWTEEKEETMLGNREIIFNVILVFNEYNKKEEWFAPHSPYWI